MADKLRKMAKTKVTDEKQKKIARYLIVFALLVVLCWMFPYTGDDWAWGSSMGIDRLNSLFEGYNGRYAGNLLVICLTRSNVLKSLVMAGCITGTIFCMEYFVEGETTFYLSVLVLLAMPRYLVRQSIVWTSGFTNYEVSIFLTLICLCILKRNYAAGDKGQQAKWAIIVFIVATISTLFVEHVTLYNVAISIILLFAYLLKMHKRNAVLISYVIGSLAGCALMFSNSAYRNIAEGSDTYRQMVGSGVIGQAIKNYFKVIYKEAYFNNIALNFMLLTVCLIALITCLPDFMSRLEKAIGGFCAIIMVVFWVYSVYSRIVYGYEYQYGEITKHTVAEGILTAINVLATIILVLLISYRRGTFIKTGFWVLSAILVTGPIFFVNPIGSRCFFASYIFLVNLTCQLIKDLPTKANVIMNSHKVLGLFLIISVVFLGRYYIIFHDIYTADADRLAKAVAAAENNKSEVDFTHLPHESYLWMPTPKGDDIWEKRYKLFHNIPEELDFNIVEYR